MKKFTFLITLTIVTLIATSCGSTTTSTEQKQSAGGASGPPSSTAPAVPDEIQKTAEKSLGSETEVLLYGDLSNNGAQQILAINRMKTTAQERVLGTVIARAVILQNDNGSWKEILRCDEHLENPKGFLGDIPLAPVNGWRLQTEQDPDKGLELYFTPVTDPKGARALPIEVRWNPKVKRYQSLDRSFQKFLGELPSLETPESQIRL
ncbi:MAG: hypothetical protein WB630_19235 [Candidatus Acidiferrales bacterium]